MQVSRQRHHCRPCNVRGGILDIFHCRWCRCGLQVEGVAQEEGKYSTSIVGDIEFGGGFTA